MSKNIGELLVRQKRITSQQLQRAQDEQRATGTRLGYNLTKLGFIKDQELTNFLSEQYGVPAIELAEFEIDPQIIKLIPGEVAQKHQIVPINRAGASLIVAMADPSNIYAIDDIKFLTGYNVESVVSSEHAIQEAIDRYYSESSASAYETVISDIEMGDDVEVVSEEEEDINDVEKTAEAAPVIKLVNLILTDAISRKASDIHVEPYEKVFRVRYRVDGILSEVMKPPMKLRSAILSRLKIMSEMDIAERRLPQDGRIKLKLGKGKEVDMRVSALPTLFGEKIVLRLLDKSNLQLDMTKLGFEEQSLDLFQEAIHKPYGMILVTGPTGSGKTTTLYSALQDLNKVTENISTAEDPVEFNFAGINQVQMHDDIGLNFASSLRSFLRQDPDIIMVGEIRDFETAEIAVKAALTGHLVLSTLHTNDAPGTINRLLNMGIEPFLVSSSVNLIMAQRLVRRVCSDCKEPTTIPAQSLVDAGMSPEEAEKVTPFQGVGCRTCQESGYKGRVALYEVMPMHDQLRELVMNGASANEIKREAIRSGLRTLRMAGLSKVGEGMTTLEEVVRITMPDN